MTQWQSAHRNLIRGRWRKGRDHSMNKLEQKRRENLEARKQSGEILEYGFEAVKLKLADSTFYTPDFLVITKDGAIQFEEVKAFWEDAARIKIKIAAKLFWWAEFRAVMWHQGAWGVETF